MPRTETAVFFNSRACESGVFASPARARLRIFCCGDSGWNRGGRSGSACSAAGMGGLFRRGGGRSSRGSATSRLALAKVQNRGAQQQPRFGSPGVGSMGACRIGNTRARDTRPAGRLFARARPRLETRSCFRGDFPRSDSMVRGIFNRGIGDQKLKPEPNRTAPTRSPSRRIRVQPSKAFAPPAPACSGNSGNAHHQRKANWEHPSFIDPRAPAGAGRRRFWKIVHPGA